MRKSIYVDDNRQIISHRVAKVFGQFLLIVRDTDGEYRAGRFDTKAEAEAFASQHYPIGKRG